MSFIEQIINIDSVETAIVKKGLEAEFLRSDDIHKYFDDNMIMISYVQYFPKLCEKYNLYFGVVSKYFKGRNSTLYFPNLCMIIDGEFHHVHYNENWLCFECMYNNGRVLRPQIESDTIIYSGVAKTEIPPIFKTQLCCTTSIELHKLLH